MLRTILKAQLLKRCYKMAELKDWQNWLKAWEEQETQSKILIEQAGLVIPAIKKKIEELKELEATTASGE